MTIKSILEQLETAKNPVAKVLHKGEQFKVLVIGFKTGMRLEDHKANQTSKLTVFSGSVIYRESEKSITLKTYDETNIPVNIIHSVEALEDSLCLLTQGDEQ